MVDGLMTRVWALALALLLSLTGFQSIAAAAPPSKPASASKSASASALPAMKPGTTTDQGYVLGANDTVQIQVYGQPDAGITTRIKPDGTIVMPLIGVITASGQTTVQLADDITRRFVKGNFFKSPVVNVEIGAYVSRTVNVAGKVAAPGVYPLDKTYRTLEMLLKAGWIKDAGANYVYLRRGSDYKEIQLDTEALVRGAPDKDPVLEPGDTLFVPDADTFYIYGQIAKPGTYPVLRNMTLRQALALSGGVTASGSERKITLHRPGQKDSDATLDQLIERNDVLIVKERLF